MLPTYVLNQKDGVDILPHTLYTFTIHTADGTAPQLSIKTPQILPTFDIVPAEIKPGSHFTITWQTDIDSRIEIGYLLEGGGESHEAIQNLESGGQKVINVPIFQTPIERTDITLISKTTNGVIDARLEKNSRISFEYILVKRY